MSRTVRNVVELQLAIYSSKNKTRRWIHCSRRDWIIDAIFRISKKYGNNRALEIGPGSGIYLDCLSESYANVLAIDNEIEFLEYLSVNNKKNVSVMFCDIVNSGIPDSEFDLVLCSEVIEHIDECNDVMSEIYRIIRPGGILLLSTPQPCSFLEILGKIAFSPVIIPFIKLIYREPVIKTGHINLMTDVEIIDNFNRLGFNVIEQHKSGLYIPFVAEFMGRYGLGLEKKIELAINNTFLDKILWTQYYIAQK